MQSAMPMFSKFTNKVGLLFVLAVDGAAVALSCYAWARLDEGFWANTLATVLLVLIGVVITSVWIVLTIEDAFREQIKADLKTDNFRANSELDLRARVVVLERAAGIRPNNNYYENSRDDKAIRNERYPTDGIDRYADEWYGTESLFPHLYGDADTVRRYANPAEPTAEELETERDDLVADLRATIAAKRAQQEVENSAAANEQAPDEARA